MPIYEYAHDSDCGGECAASFEVIQSMGAEPLTVCPTCGKGCHRIFSEVSHSMSKAGLLSKKNLEAKGFTQYKKAGDGYYEKTAGTEGPDVIRR